MKKYSPGKLLIPVSLCLLATIFFGCDAVMENVRKEMAELLETAEEMSSEEILSEPPADTTLNKETQPIPADTEEDLTTEVDQTTEEDLTTEAVQTTEEDLTTEVEETTRAEETQPIEIVDLEDLSTMFTMFFTDPEDNTVSLVADLFMAKVSLSWMYTMDDIQVVEGKIYIFGVLYEQVSDPVPALNFDYCSYYLPYYPDTTCFDQDLLNIDPDEAKKKMQESTFCYFLKPAPDQTTILGPIVVYRIDNAYYFVTYNPETGFVTRVHCAMIK